MSSNFDSQIAYGLEATPGTRQAPSRRIEHSMLKRSTALV